MKVGAPSIAMVCLEWWSFELMTFIAAFISVDALAVQILTMNNAGLFYMPHVGI